MEQWHHSALQKEASGCVETGMHSSLTYSEAVSVIAHHTNWPNCSLHKCFIIPCSLSFCVSVFVSILLCLCLCFSLCLIMLYDCAILVCGMWYGHQRQNYRKGALYFLGFWASKFSVDTVEEVSSCAEADESQDNCSTSLSKRKNSVRNKKHASKHHLGKFNDKDDEEKVRTVLFCFNYIFVFNILIIYFYSSLWRIWVKLAP